MVAELVDERVLPDLGGPPDPLHGLRLAYCYLDRHTGICLQSRELFLHQWSRLTTLPERNDPYARQSRSGWLELETMGPGGSRGGKVLIRSRSDFL